MQVCVSNCGFFFPSGKDIVAENVTELLISIEFDNLSK